MRFIILIFTFLCIFSCKQNPTENQNQTENQPDITKRDDFEIKCLNVQEIQDFIEIAEQDLELFSEFSNNGIIFREDPLNPGREDGGRTYCLGFAIKVQKAIATNYKGETYEIGGPLFVSRLDLDVPSMDSISVLISTDGHARDQYYETYTSLNQKDERTIQIRKTTEGWRVVKVSQTNPAFDEKLFNKTPGDVIDEPMSFEKVFDEKLPDTLQQRLDQLCDLVWQKGAKKVMTYEKAK